MLKLGLWEIVFQIGFKQTEAYLCIAQTSMALYWSHVINCMSSELQVPKREDQMQLSSTVIGVSSVTTTSFKL